MSSSLDELVPLNEHPLVRDLVARKGELQVVRAEIDRRIGEELARKSVAPANRKEAAAALIAGRPAADTPQGIDRAELGALNDQRRLHEAAIQLLDEQIGAATYAAAREVRERVVLPVYRAVLQRMAEAAIELGRIVDEEVAVYERVEGLGYPAGTAVGNRTSILSMRLTLPENDTNRLSWFLRDIERDFGIKVR